MHWRVLAILILPLALVGCPPKVGSTQPTPEPAPDGPAPEPAATPRPTGLRVQPSVGVSSDGPTPTFEGFPAASADGRWVALAVVLEDGARGADNGAVRLVEVDSGVEREAALLTVEEGEALDDDGVRARIAKRLPQRLEAAAELLAGKTWHGLDGLAAGDPHPDHSGATRELTFGDLVIRFREPRLTITRGSRTLVAQDFPQWTPPVPRYEGCDPEQDLTCICVNEPVLSAGWVDLATRVLVLRIAYTGHDTCWEPEARLHVMRLPP
jgi:hypothetical protein